MIRLIFFLLTGIFFTISPSFSQTDSVEWAPIGAKWWYDFGKGSIIGGYAAHFVTLESTSDTLVHNKLARVLDIRVHYAEGYLDTIPYYFLADHKDLKLILHQQGDSVFYLRKNKFEILYDFSLEVGDTMTVVHPLLEYDRPDRDTMLYLRIDSVGTIEVDGKKLRTQNVSLYPPHDKYPSGYVWGSEIIEKVGNVLFFLPFSDLECDAACPVPIRCYQDDEIFYKRVDVPCDTLVPLKSSNQRAPVSETVTLYPNPVPYGYSHVKIRGLSVDAWILRDVRGKVLYRTESDACTSEIGLPRHIRTGIYFIELRSGSQRYVKRLVVQ